ncbi:MAG: [protein-PII] uridylyltransferase [Planctomycetota bacterium]|nr:MAG: [protein-PII] uridylyltransferase [Planctomycetota bacterium]
MSGLPTYVVEAKRRLTRHASALVEGYSPAVPIDHVMRSLVEIRDGVVLEILRHAVESRYGTTVDWSRDCALVALGGYALEEVCPRSDIDLLLLVRDSERPAAEELAGRFFRDLYDTGLSVGHALRSPRECCRLAAEDAEILTSLIEPRLLWGNRELLDDLLSRLAVVVRKQRGRLVRAVLEARHEERVKYGDTVYLLEPNVKRSPGGLRDIRLLHWLSYLTASKPQTRVPALEIVPAELHPLLTDARAKLLRIRTFLHVRSPNTNDVLTRAMQLRLAEELAVQARPGLIPVECLMQDYFQTTEDVLRAVRVAETAASSVSRVGRLVDRLTGHRLPGGFFAGIRGLSATSSGRKRLEQSPAAILEFLELAQLYDLPIEPETRLFLLKNGIQPAACDVESLRKQFLSLLQIPTRLGQSLRLMHELRLLEQFVPHFARARGLIQFNQYHKYTVDEHCLLAVEQAARLVHEDGLLGRVYRAVEEKHILHLALLLHDLGKGTPCDHCETGKSIAQTVAARLGLGRGETERLTFLVHRHQLMNHVSQRRDITNPQEILGFALQVGTPELLQMLYVLSAADLQAVGPDAWSQWKGKLLETLYRATQGYLADEEDDRTREHYLPTVKNAVMRLASSHPQRRRLEKQIAALPASYLRTTDPPDIIADLELLRSQETLAPCAVRFQYDETCDTLHVVVATRESVAAGIFHRLVGALTGRGLEILSAHIHTLADGRILDRFRVRDPDFVDRPPQERLHEIEQAVKRSLGRSGKAEPRFRRVWNSLAMQKHDMSTQKDRVEIDTHSCDTATIVEVFTADRRGVLYTIAKAVFDLDLEVTRAKIGTYLDQVVDVFYVTDKQGRKIVDPARLLHIRESILATLKTHRDRD